MRRLAIHIAIALYPRHWRQRYGAELEEAALEDACSSRGRAVYVVLDLATHGLLERLRSRRSRQALVVYVLLGTVAALLVSASTPAVTGYAPLPLLDSPGVPPETMVVAIDANLGPGVQVVRTSAAPYETLDRRSKQLTITVDALTGAVISIAGQGKVRLEPNADRILSATVTGGTVSSR